MTIRHLKIFLEVYKEQNITRAAETLHMTQPVVTRAIQELEAYYGICLFERINHRLSISEAGKKFYPVALHIIDSYDLMEMSMKDWDQFGTLRVGATITLGTYLLPNLLSEFSQTYKKLQIRTVVTNSAKLQDDLENNMLDLALIEGECHSDNLVRLPFSCDTLRLILPPNHELLKKEKLSLADLRDYPLLVRDTGSVGRDLTEHVFASHGLPFNPVMESSSTQAIVHAAHSGLGISILPEALVARDIESGYVSSCEICDASFTRTHYIVYHKNKFLTQSAKAFIDLCRNSAALN